MERSGENQITANSEVVIEMLTQQVGLLSRELAIYKALMFEMEAAAKGQFPQAVAKQQQGE